MSHVKFEVVVGNSINGERFVMPEFWAAVGVADVIARERGLRVCVYKLMYGNVAVWNNIPLEKQPINVIDSSLLHVSVPDHS